MVDVSEVNQLMDDMTTNNGNAADGDSSGFDSDNDNANVLVLSDKACDGVWPKQNGMMARASSMSNYLQIDAGQGSQSCREWTRPPSTA